MKEIDCFLFFLSNITCRTYFKLIFFKIFFEQLYFTYLENVLEFERSGIQTRDLETGRKYFSCVWNNTLKL